MTCPKCGSGVADGAPQCGICFFNLEQGADQSAAASAPLAFRMPVAPTVVDQDEPVAGIPGIDNMPSAAPLGGAPAPLPGVGSAPLPGAGSGQFRVSLTGEMIEVPGAMPTMSTRSMDGRQPGAASLAGNGAAALPPPVGIRPQVGAPAPPRAASSMPPRAGTSSRRISPRPAADEYAGRKSGSGAIIAVVIVLLLAGGGAFGWFYWQKTHGPASVVTEFWAAFKSGDAKKVVTLIEVPPDQKSQAEALVSQQLTMINSLSTIKEVKVGEATINGDSGSVKVTIVAALTDSAKGMAAALGKGGNANGENTVSANMPVVKVNGAWKIDVTHGTGITGVTPGIGGGK